MVGVWALNPFITFHLNLLPEARPYFGQGFPAGAPHWQEASAAIICATQGRGKFDQYFGRYHKS
jgi:hypothetical protein